jgi:hypothetical protein
VVVQLVLNVANVRVAHLGKLVPSTLTVAILFLILVELLLVLNVLLVLLLLVLLVVWLLLLLLVVLVLFLLVLLVLVALLLLLMLLLIYASVDERNKIHCFSSLYSYHDSNKLFVASFS